MALQLIEIDTVHRRDRRRQRGSVLHDQAARGHDNNHLPQLRDLRRQAGQRPRHLSSTSPTPPAEPVTNPSPHQILSITNADPSPIRIALVGGSLWPLHVSTPEGGPIRNLTAIPYNVEIPAGTNQSLTYNFATELHPQDLRLVLAAVVAREEVGYQVAAFNGTVSVVEAPLSFFDPQM